MDLARLIDLRKEEVFITHIFPEEVKKGLIIPLSYISRLNDIYIEGIDSQRVLVESDILSGVEDGSIIQIPNPVRLMPNQEPFLFEGIYDPAKPNTHVANVYLANKDNPVLYEKKILLVSYNISNSVRIIK